MITAEDKVFIQECHEDVMPTTRTMYAIFETKGFTTDEFTNETSGGAKFYQDINGDLFRGIFGQVSINNGYKSGAIVKENEYYLKMNYINLLNNSKQRLFDFDELEFVYISTDANNTSTTETFGILGIEEQTIHNETTVVVFYLYKVQ